MTRAAIDIGTNTVRLAAGAERRMRVTRLGEGVDAAGHLSPVAAARTAAAVNEFIDLAYSLGATSVRVAGTSALRDAADPAVFTSLVSVPVEILSGDEEAMLSWLGAGGRGVVLDIGGGSTEIVAGPASGVSLQIGSVRLTERFADRRLAVGVIDEALGRADHIAGGRPLVGVAGTITTLAQVEFGIATWTTGCVHGEVLRADRVAAWSEQLFDMAVDDVRNLPGMEPGRADVFCAGVLICRRVMERWGYDEIEVSESDILDGLLIPR